MLTNLGRKTPPEDVVDLLQECHGRIRTFLALARRIGEATDAPSGEIAEAATRVLRYFSEALPLHARDEEESVLPRLEGLDPALDEALARMAREHDGHEDLLGRLTSLMRTLAASPDRLPAHAAELTTVSGTLEREFATHLALEEEVVFPAIRAHLDAAERERMREELRARRSP